MIIEKAVHGDLMDIVSLQKQVFQREAISFNDYSIPPLTQSTESIEEDFKSNVYLKAVSNGETIGSVRAYEKESVCYIGRLFVHLDHQNKGLANH